MSGDTKISIAKADLDWDKNTPRSIFFDDIYFSGNGFDESQHVFLNGNGLAARFAAANRFAIAELGFGTALNLLATWALWQRTKKSVGARLDFVSIEKYPLSSGALRRAAEAWPTLAPLSEKLIKALPPVTPGFHYLSLANDVRLTLAYGEVSQILANIDGRFDAWYLDGFAPAKNPDMWREALFGEMARLSKPGATFSTFTVAGAVRRGLTAAGFSVERRAGYGRKREMLTGKISFPKIASVRHPWVSNAHVGALETGASIAIIGGGIAGASMSAALTKFGFRPTIVDPLGLAGGASGNPAGLIMPRLDLGETAATHFFKAAYLYAIRWLTNRQAPYFHATGAVMRAGEQGARLEKIYRAQILPPGWIEKIPDGLFFPQAGTIDPSAFCVDLAEQTPIIPFACTKIIQSDDRTELVFSNNERLPFDGAIIANGRDAKKLLQARTLPLMGVAGQLDWFPHAVGIKQAVVAGPYIAPAPKGGIIAGATYEKIGPDKIPKPTAEATIENRKAALAFAPHLTLDPATSRPRASVRCQTPDQLPIIGALPDWDQFGAEYDGLRTGVQKGYRLAQYQPRLWVFTGLGSRGLVTALYCAEMIAASIADAPCSAPRSVIEAVHPARFFIRALKRGAP